jgi:16S rRNA (guanine966-N2)-methyltransferase
MRVIAGSLRGRRIESPRGDATRPTTDKVREAVFNSLGSLDVVVGATVVDLFAGTGAMGIEALSRGATRCTFVERDRNALAVLVSNISALGLEGKSQVVSGDASSSRYASIECDLLIADPPYGFDRWQELLDVVRASFVVCESGDSIGEVSGWEVVREGRYGRTMVTFLRPSPSRTAPSTDGHISHHST